ncbi:MAG: L-lactate dehydrogenase [Phycisphaerae bacterium]
MTVMASAGSSIAIVGSGSVGATIAYAAMLRGIASDITLIDANTAKCEAEAKDLIHGLRFVPSVRVRAGSIADCASAAVVVITAGAKQKPGQSRLDLAATNVGIFRELIPAVARAAPQAVVLIVSNPVDVLTYAAVKLHPGGPERVLGSGTVLDSSRFVTLIAARLGVSVHNVHAFIIGEHGESELPLWSSAHVGNVPLSDFHPPDRPGLTDRDRSEIVSAVRSAAGEIIAAKGATNWAIGLAVGRILEAVLRHENAVLPVSRLLADYHGVSDVCLSVPCLVHRGGAQVLPAVPMTEPEIAALRESARVLRRACAQAGLT